MSEKSMGDKADLLQIFGKKLYVLPLNQRPYSWTKKQCEELFEDIADLPARKNLFLGSVILSDAKRTVRDQDHDQISVRRVEDGQQRLTTLFLLIATLKEAMAKRGIDQDLVDKFEKMITFQDSRGNDLFKIENDFQKLQSDFKEIMIKGSLGKPSHPAGKRLKATFQFFQKRIEALTKRNVEAISKKVAERVFLSLVELDDKFDIELTFEGMNSRGLGLSQLDKIKNYAILIISKKRKGLKVEKNHFVENVWFKTIRTLDAHGLNGHSKEDQFISDCVCTWVGSSAHGPSKVHDWFKDHFGCLVHDESPEKAKEFNEFMKFWKEYIDPYSLVMGDSSSRLKKGKQFTPDGMAWIDRIQRTGRRNVGHQILVAAFAKFDKKQFEMVAEFIELYIFRLLINRTSTVRVDKNKSIFFKNAHEIMNSSRDCKKTLKSIWNYVAIEKQHLSKLVDHLFTCEDMYSGTSTGWQDSKYFLYEYDGCIENDRPIIRYEDLRDVNQEHIIPQSVVKSVVIDRKHEWNYCYNTRGDAYEWVKLRMHSLGNLALITSETNSVLQDKSFSHKVRMGSRCYRDDTASLRQLAHIVGKRRSFDESLMDRRIKWMKAFTAIRWTFPVKDDIKKTEAYLKKLKMAPELSERIKNKLDQKKRVQKRPPSF